MKFCYVNFNYIVFQVEYIILEKYWRVRIVSNLLLSLLIILIGIFIID